MFKSIKTLRSVISNTSNLYKISSNSNNSSFNNSIVFILRRSMSTSNVKLHENLFVKPEWLKENLNKVKVVDASWYMPHEKRDIRADFEANHIDGAVLFDIDEICDKSVQLPHNLPSVEQFEREVSGRLGISDDDHIVIYDTRGTYVASARVWWTFLVFGHKATKLSILSGGLPAWKRAGLPTVAGPIQTQPSKPATYRASFMLDLVKSCTDIQENIKNRQYQVVDARVADRFYGRVDEPRPGLHRGHIPGALNVPWVEIVNSADGGYHEKDRVLQLFKTNGINVDKPILTTCGSGTTAAVLSLALHSFGYPVPPIYDGSWSEWGQPHLNLPTETEKKN